MAALDLFNLNKQIVSMRHDVRQARVHAISRLIREIRLLRVKKGSKQKKEKYLRKSERLLEVLKCVKTLKEDKVSKFVLLNKEDPDAVLNDVEKSAEDRALARLVKNKIIIASLNEFKKKYPNWFEEVAQLLPNLGKKSSKKNLSLKKNNKVKSPPKQEVESRLISPDVTEDCSDKNDKNQTLCRTGLNNFAVESTSDKNIKRKSLDSLENGVKKKRKKHSIDPGTKLLEKHDKKEFAEKKMQMHGKYENKDKREFSKKKKKKHDLDLNAKLLENDKKKEFSEKKSKKKDVNLNVMLLENDEKKEFAKTYKNKKLKSKIMDKGTIQTKESGDTQKDVKNEIEVTNKGKERRVVDPFFVTGTDDVYTTIVTNEKQVEALQNSITSPFGFENDRYNKKKMLKGRGSFDRHSNFNSNERPFGGKSREREPSRRERRERMHFGSASVQEKQEILHPSWEAKRRQSFPVITQFAGKKIVFDD